MGIFTRDKRGCKKAGIDPKTGLHCTGFEEYLATIFLGEEWVHNKCVPGLKRKIRPNYRCERLKLIVEFDGLPHYENPNIIKRMRRMTKYIGRQDIKW